MPEPLSTKDAFELYESGKHRRYTLLFAVNGGAFAVAKLLVEDEPLGWLNLTMVALAMAILNAAMTADIYWFGEKIRQEMIPGVFAWRGKTVLISIGGLLYLAWLLVAMGLTFGGKISN
jgi:hypothetical protein